LEERQWEKTGGRAAGDGDVRGMGGTLLKISNIVFYILFNYKLH
jgi:hypothetical protein